MTTLHELAEKYAQALHESWSETKWEDASEADKSDALSQTLRLLYSMRLKGDLPHVAAPTVVDFMLYAGGDMRQIRAVVPDKCLEDVELPAGSVLLLEVRSPEHARHVGTWMEEQATDALQQILMVAAALTHRPWETKEPWPKWADSPWPEPLESESALFDAAYDWNAHQRARHLEDHPTGRSDAQTYREEAPYGSEQG